MNAVRLPTSPALPEHSTDATGVVTGNADIEQPDDWKPWSGPKERAPLPGHEHLADINNLSEALAFVAFWPCIGLIAWMAIDPYGFRDALLRVLGVA